MRIGIIGGHALRRYLDISRKSIDTDIVATYDDAVQYMKEAGHIREIYPFAEGKKMVAKYVSGEVIEAEIAWPGSLSAELLDIITDTDGIWYADLNTQYMLKMSHRYLKNSPHFLKTMRDIHLMRGLGAHIPESQKAFFMRREKATYDYKLPNLNQSKKEFFKATDQDRYGHKYDHDSIHRAVMLFDQPAYEFYKPDVNEVYTSAQMFDSQPHFIKIAGVYEEACVLALERSQIVHGDSVKPSWSFNKALEKVCTSITSGWFREFAWENFDEVRNFYYKQGEDDYVKRFRAGLENGVVIEIS